MTGFIVESEADAVAAIGRARHLDRGRIRETFERRFSARRMAEAYVESYQALLESARSRAGDQVRNNLRNGTSVKRDLEDWDLATLQSEPASSRSQAPS